MGAVYFKGTKAKFLPTTGLEFSDGRFYAYGSGSPEGVVTATIGSFYSDTTNGFIYTKNSGTGNTGWAFSASLTTMAAGTSSAPGLPFTGDTDTGIYQPNANEIGFVTNGAERLRIESTGQIKAVYESTVGTDYNTTLHNGYLCRAWINFEGGISNSIRASGNISSVTYNAIGDYTVSFTSALPDEFYSVEYNGGGKSGYRRVLYQTGMDQSGNQVLYTTSAFRVISFDESAAGAIDMVYNNVAVFR